MVGVGNPVLTKVTINSIDVSSKLFEADMNPLLGTLVKETEISLHRSVYDLVPELETIPTGLSVIVQRGVTSPTEEFVFRGTVQKRITLGSRVVLDCKDKLFSAVQKNITKTFSSNIDTEQGKISELFKTLATTAGLSTSNLSVQDSGTVIILKTFICNHADIIERMQFLAEFLDWQFYYDSTDDLLHFEPKGTRSGTGTLTVGTNVQNRPKWLRDGTKIIKTATIFGGPVDTQTSESFTATASQTEFDLLNLPVSVKITVDGTLQEGGIEDQSPNADYFVERVTKSASDIVIGKIKFVTPLTGGENVVIDYSFLSPIVLDGENSVAQGLDVRLDKPNLITVSDVQDYLETYLSRHSVDFLSTVLQVSNVTELDVGQTVQVIDSNEGINDTFIIKRIRKRFPYAFDEVEVDTEPIQIEDWSISIEDRIRRIEERLLQEESLVIHVRTGNRLIKIGREWMSIEKRDTSTDTLWTRDTWDGGIWDEEFDNVPVLEFMSQGGDIYIEDFKDTDFNDSSTASWTNTGSVSFTAGQVADSSSIDFNNKSITKVKLTSIEVSGSFTYEVTADGTNYEEVTSGVLHNFTNTGTDLRWRATENSASTGEISELRLEDY